MIYERITELGKDNEKMGNSQKIINVELAKVVIICSHFYYIMINT